MADAPILLLGAGGQVGLELRRALAPLGVVALDRSGADFADLDALRAVVRRYRPCIVVNAAAYTAVDRAECEPEIARRVNAEAPGVLAEETSSADAILVHYSTDYVFDGSKEGSYREDDVPNPLSVYGRTKLAGERAVAARCQRHVILRTSWVFGAHRGNFLATVLRLAAERDKLRIVADQHGAPTDAALIADVTVAMLQALEAHPDGPAWGVYHLAAAGETSWHEYARYVVARARSLGASLRATPETIEAISSAEYPTAAARPRNSRLDTSRIRAHFGVALPDWRLGVDQVLGRLQLQITS